MPRGLLAKLLWVCIGATFLSPSALAQVQINQAFIPQGPSPKFGAFDPVGSGDADEGASGTVSGAVQAILLDPSLGPDTMFIGSTNGGVWRTTDGGATWKALTDNQASLSIGSLALDTMDSRGMTLVAGIGITSSGAWGPGVAGSGGPQTGLLYSTDGGQSWTPMGAADLQGQSVIGVAARGDTILAATFEERAPTMSSVTVGKKQVPLGLYISTNGGKHFELATGLPSGPVTSLVADPDPTRSKTFYAAVTISGDPANAGVYVTHDAGQHWKPFFTGSTAVNGAPNAIATAGDQSVLGLATGPDGSVAVAVIGATDNELHGLYLLPERKGFWSALPNPLTNQGDPSNVLHFALAIDPGDTSIVYVAGSDQAPPLPTTMPAFAVQAQGFTSLTCNFDKKGQCKVDGGPIGTVHADARGFAIDQAGNLFLVGDGGVYVHSPQGNGVWTGLNTATLQVAEPYQIGYGAYANRIVLAAQDTGVGIQSEPGKPLYKAVQSADGHVAVVRDVNDPTFANQPVSVYYTSEQSLDELQRIVLDTDGQTVSPTSGPAGVAVRCKDPAVDPKFKGCAAATGGKKRDQKVTFALNGVDPTRIALSSGFDVYVAQDLSDASALTVDLTLTDVSQPPPRSSPVRRAFAFGASDNPDVLLAGGANALLATTNSAAGTLAKLPEYGGATPLSLVFGETSATFYVADGTNVWGGTLAGATPHVTATIADLTGDLPSDIVRPTSVEFISNNGVDALLVGGLMACSSGTCSASQSPIAMANSDNGHLQGWSPFGSGLPNALVYQMSYNQLADVLAVASVGRGAWTLYDVTSYFPQATALQFGLANNDSLPDSIHLTDGTLLNGTAFVRPLNKYGTGTLTIAGDASYTGGTTIFDGILQLGDGRASGSILGDVRFCNEPSNPLCNPDADKFLVFDRSDVYSFSGAISGPGQVVKTGVGTTILTGANTYTGPTWVDQGALIVNGSLVSPVAVNFGGLLGGNGSVGATAIGYGGVLTPGNSIGTMTVNGDLTLDPGSLYIVEANAEGQSDKVVVKGAVNLTDATLRVLAAGGAYEPSTGYVIIDNDGSDAVDGTFGQVTNNLAFLIPSVAYDGGTGNDVVLTLERNSSLFTDVAHTRNQHAVAGALDQFPTDNPLFLSVLNQTAKNARHAFDALSGEIHASVAEILANDSHYVREAVLGRMMQATYAGRDAQMAALAFAGPQAASLDVQALALAYNDTSLRAPTHARPTFWTQAYGDWADFNGDGNAAAANRNLGGFVSGLDVQAFGSWRVGLATGASFSRVNVDGRDSSADIESYNLAAYLGGMAGPFALRGGGAWTWNNIDTSRAVTFPGFSEAERASYDAGTGQLFGEVAVPTAMWGMALEPFAGRHVSVDTNSFHEKDGALASLRGAGGSQGFGYVTVGLRAATTMDWRGMVLTPHVSAAWQHAFDDVTPAAALAFDFTGIGFTVYGVPLARDSALIEAGLDFALGPNTTAGVSYSGQFGDGVQHNGVQGRFAWRF